MEDLKNVDVSTVEKEILVDVDDIKIDKKLSLEEKRMEFVKQIKNPYCFICEGIIVKSKFVKKGETFEELFSDYICAL